MIYQLKFKFIQIKWVFNYVYSFIKHPNEHKVLRDYTLFPQENELLSN